MCNDPLHWYQPVPIFNLLSLAPIPDALRIFSKHPVNHIAIAFRYDGAADFQGLGHHAIFH